MLMRGKKNGLIPTSSRHDKFLMFALSYANCSPYTELIPICFGMQNRGFVGFIVWITSESRVLSSDNTYIQYASGQQGTSGLLMSVIPYVKTTVVSTHSP